MHFAYWGYQLAMNMYSVYSTQVLSTRMPLHASNEGLIDCPLITSKAGNLTANLLCRNSPVAQQIAAQTLSLCVNCTYMP